MVVTSTHGFAMKSLIRALVKSKTVASSSKLEGPSGCYSRIVVHFSPAYQDFAGSGLDLDIALAEDVEHVRRGVRAEE